MHEGLSSALTRPFKQRANLNGHADGDTAAGGINTLPLRRTTSVRIPHLLILGGHRSAVPRASAYTITCAVERTIDARLSNMDIVQSLETNLRTQLKISRGYLLACTLRVQTRPPSTALLAQLGTHEDVGGSENISTCRKLRGCGE